MEHSFAHGCTNADVNDCLEKDKALCTFAHPNSLTKRAAAKLTSLKVEVKFMLVSVLVI
ncbi:hypothetical protein D918_01839 [Trichuris suis]|nr:hypothetical protein D918_01839 [Trichuris suis]